MPIHCVLTRDVPGRAEARGTAAAFGELAGALGLSLLDEACFAPACLARRGCATIVTHEWRSPVAEWNREAPPLPLLVNVHGGLVWSLDAARRRSLSLRQLEEDARQLAALDSADRVVFPSRTMRAHHCDGARGGAPAYCARATVIGNVVPRAPVRVEHAPVRAFAFVGALTERKGVLRALDAVCALPTSLHVFGRSAWLPTARRHASEAIDEARRRCRARIVPHGAQPRARLWPRLRRLGACVLAPSTTENQPMLLADAERNGVPLLALNISAVAEMLSNAPAIAPAGEFGAAVARAWRTRSQTVPRLGPWAEQAPRAWAAELEALHARARARRDADARRAAATVTLLHGQRLLPPLDDDRASDAAAIGAGATCHCVDARRRLQGAAPFLYLRAPTDDAALLDRRFCPLTIETSLLARHANYTQPWELGWRLHRAGIAVHVERRRCYRAVDADAFERAPRLPAASVAAWDADRRVPFRANPPGLCLAASAPARFRGGLAGLVVSADRALARALARRLRYGALYGSDRPARLPRPPDDAEPCAALEWTALPLRPRDAAALATNHSRATLVLVLADGRLAAARARVAEVFASRGALRDALRRALGESEHVAFGALADPRCAGARALARVDRRLIPDWMRDVCEVARRATPPPLLALQARGTPLILVVSDRALRADNVAFVHDRVLDGVSDPTRQPALDRRAADTASDRSASGQTERLPPRLTSEPPSRSEPVF